MAIDLNISKFISTAAVKDFARNNLFRVMSLNCRNLSLSEDDLIYCKGGKLPGRSTPVGDNVSYHGMKMPYTKSTVEYTGNTAYDLKFYLDANSDIWKKFESASRYAFNDLTNTGQWNFPRVSDTLTVAVLNFKLEPIDYITFYGVSFVKFDEVAFDSAGGDGTALEIGATISYIYYKNSTGASDVAYS